MKIYSYYFRYFMRRPPILMFSNFIHSNKFTGLKFGFFFFPSFFYLLRLLLFLCVFFLHFQNTFPIYMDALLLSDLISILIILAYLLFTYCLQYFRNCFFFLNVLFFISIYLQFGIKSNDRKTKRNKKTKINMCLLKLQEGFLLVVKLTKLCVCVSLFTHCILRLIMLLRFD